MPTSEQENEVSVQPSRKSLFINVEPERESLDSPTITTTCSYLQVLEQKIFIYKLLWFEFVVFFISFNISIKLLLLRLLYVTCGKGRRTKSIITCSIANEFCIIKKCMLKKKQNRKSVINSER